jgi:hypothetical protein
MLNLQSQFEPGPSHDRFEGTESRLNILRRQIAFYRQNLRQSFDAEFAAIYAREIARAERELGDLLGKPRC